MNATVHVGSVIDASPFSRFQKRVVLVSLLLVFADGFNALSIGYAIPDLAERYGAPAAAFAFVVITALVGEIVAEFVLAPLADRYGRRRVIRTGILLFGIAAIPSYFVTSIGALAVCRFAAGVGIGMAVPNGYALGAEFSPERAKATTITLLSIGTSGGGVVAGLLASWLVPVYDGQTLLLVAGVLPLAILGLTWRFLPESVEYLARAGQSAEVARLLGRIDSQGAYSAGTTYAVTGSTTGAGVRALFRGGRASRTLLIWFMLFFALFNTYFMFSWLTTMLTNAGVVQADALLATSMGTFGGMAGALVLGVLVDRTRAGAGAVVAGPAMGVIGIGGLMWTLGAGAHSGFVLVFAAFFGFGTLGTAGALTAITTGAYPTPIRATGVGWASGFSRIGGLVAPALGGAMLAGGLTANAMLGMSAVPLVVVAVLVVAYRFVSRNPLADTPAPAQAAGRPAEAHPRAGKGRR